VAFSAWFAGDVVWCIYELILHQQPFPSLADVGYLAFYPCAVWALLTFPAPRRRRNEWVKLGLDALTVLLCAAMGIWYLVVGPIVHDSSGQGLATVLNVAYPVGDLVLFFGVLVVLMRRPGGGRRCACSWAASNAWSSPTSPTPGSRSPVPTTG